MRSRKSRSRVLLVGGGAAVLSALAGLAQAETLGERLKKAKEQMDKAVDKVDRATQKAQSAVDTAQRGAARIQAEIDRASEAVNDINDQVVRANQYVDRITQAANAVEHQGRLIPEDPAAADQFFSALTDLLGATAGGPASLAAASRGPAVGDVAEQATGNVPSLDGLFEASAAPPTMRIVKQGPLQGLPIRLGNFAFEQQVLEATVDVGAAARGLATAPAVLDDAAFMAWLQSGEAAGSVFAFRIASSAEQLGELNAAARSGSLLADLICDVIEVSRPDGTKTLVVRPTRIQVRMTGAAPVAG